MQSKLPEHIVRQIEHEASKATEHLKEGNDYQAGYSKGIEDGYEQGATAWAPWKVKYDELKERCDKLEAEATERINQIAQLQIEKMELLEKIGE
jgi:flagellar biosynthesis/type III secretory pathway protein FliH